MKIEHVAVWTPDLERLRYFYERYFAASAGEKYMNVKKGFQSYFLNFDDGARLEIMQMPGIQGSPNSADVQCMGLIHLAISVGSVENVDLLTERLRTDNYNVVGNPRWTGDGYYESVVLDPDGNRIEITI
ncbi:VOC family protein [Chryseolinea sp. T2]|uniref:VOC family protein n=1 Tax=Chryseolinea sp. T2 TaxID=3129255 RepID=UPI0030788F21